MLVVHRRVPVVHLSVPVVQLGTSIEHLGVVQDGREDTTSDTAKQFAPALENYTFVDRNGATEVLVDMDTVEEHRQMFESSWPKALQKLKELAEK